MDKENNKNKENRIPKIAESVFCIGYLIFDLIAAIIFFRTNNNILHLFGVLSLVLGFGDSFHLVPRVIKNLFGDVKNIEWWLGLGLQVSSITMTIFYIILYYIWKAIFPDINESVVFSIVIWIASIIRIVVCLLPQNNWFSKDGNPTLSKIRNGVFAVVGIMLIILFIMSGNTYNYGLWKMAIAIVISFVCYLPVTLFAKKHKAVGMLMIPKTMAYIWLISMGLTLINVL